MVEPTQIMSSLRFAYWFWGIIKNGLFFLRDEIYYKLIKRETFYFKNYCKHLTIYRNGHGILINSCEIRVLNKDKFERFKRNIDISDGKINAVFKPLKEIKMDLPCDRFNKLGFWYNINTVSDLLEGIDDVLSENKKSIDFIFKFNKGVLKSLKGRSFKLSYALSIPGMFPIINGIFDSANKPDSFAGFSSSLEVFHRVEEITYIISFEKGIEVDKSNISFYNEYKESMSNGRKIIQKDLNFTLDPDVFYNKFLVKIIKPRYQSQIVVKWNVKEES